MKKNLNKKRKRDKNISSEQKPEGGFFDMNLRNFLSRIDKLKNTPNYKKKGPYIYCVVKRELNFNPNFSSILYAFNLYHTGIFECTKELLIHYGEEDEKGNKKPLLMEKKNDYDLKQYEVIKYFYSKEKPEDFINLIDKSDWTAEKYDELYHNCIQCVNEYLIINNIKPIFFGFKRSVAYEYLCDKCYKLSKVKKLYSGDMDFFETFYQIYTKDGDPYETSLDKSKSEFAHTCEKCLDGTLANWKFDLSLMQNSEEESMFTIPVKDEIENSKKEFEELKEIYKKKFLQNSENEKIHNIPPFMEKFEDFKKEIEKYKKIGESLTYALMRVKLQKIPKNQYAVVRKNLIEGTGEKERNYGFIALVSLHENKIIEYGNKEYNEGSPVLRKIELEDKYIYHIVKEFQLNMNIDELFHSINLTPWKANRYDIFNYNSYNFINIYLNKYNQKLVLIKNIRSFNSAYLYLCRECYKKFNHPNCYIDGKSFRLHTHSEDKEKEDKYWWCWECGKEATFYYSGVPFYRKNIIFVMFVIFN